MTRALRQLVGAALVGVLAGGAAAGFLLALAHVTSLRETHGWLTWTLPAIGAVLGLVLARWGRAVIAGTSGVLASIHDGAPPIDRALAPLVLGGTLITHLGGGSAGREGTAVQMGAGLAEQVARIGWLREHRRTLLIAGIAGGFGAVFGTPLAGAVFAIEVLAVGTFAVSALPAALVAALIGDRVVARLGVTHTHYPAPTDAAWTWSRAGAWLALAVAIAVVVALFVRVEHALRDLTRRWLPHPCLRLAIAGALVVGLWALFHLDAYLGLGVPTIVRAFTDPSLPRDAFAWKAGLTALTVGAGFVGGEVTPLFFVGATLANALAAPLGLPLALAAAVGMAATFGAAANTPLALSIMAAELVGLPAFLPTLLVAHVATLLKGRADLYAHQRSRKITA